MTVLSAVNYFGSDALRAADTAVDNWSSTHLSPGARKAVNVAAGAGAAAGLGAIVVALVPPLRQFANDVVQYVNFITTANPEEREFYNFLAARHTRDIPLYAQTHGDIEHLRELGRSVIPHLSNHPQPIHTYFDIGPHGMAFSHAGEAQFQTHANAFFRPLLRWAMR